MMPLQINKPKTPKQNKYGSTLIPSSQKRKNKATHKIKTLKKRTPITIEKPSRRKKAKLVTI